MYRKDLDKCITKQATAKINDIVKSIEKHEEKKLIS